MKLIYPIVCFALAFPTLTVSVSHWLEPNTESVYTVQKECFEYLRLPEETIQQINAYNYPDTPEVRKLTHCILIALHAWGDDNLPKPYVIKNFFQPSKSDTCFENRTQDCMDKSVKTLPADDNLGRAYHTFRCYFYQYGHVVEEEQFIPFNDLNRRQLMKESIAIVNVPKESLQKFCKGVFFEVEAFPNFIFTDSVRTGFYNPQSGVNFDGLYTQFGCPEIISEDTRNCVCSVQKQYFGEPTRLYQIFKQCFAHIIPTLELLQSVAQGLLESTPAPTCNVCGATTPAPFYGYGGSSSVSCSACGKSNEIPYTKLQPRYNVKN